MRETEFIEQNKEKWKRLEQLGASKQKDPEQLGDLFVEVTNDLSYAKSFFGNRSIRVYLNNLAMKVHSTVYRSRGDVGSSLKGLWFDVIPKVYREARWSILIAAILFFGSVMVGVFSSSQDQGFVGVMLPQEYIDMTLKNMEKGDPMAVYKNMGQMEMFSYITFNNILVAFRVFLLGALFMVGTVAAMLYEGARLGAFHFLFYENGFLRESLLTVWMHGTPEISGIVLAAAAGLELGKGLVFPGTYRRKESFLVGARRGVIMMLGLIPVFLFAGFIEGFATRYTEMPDLLRIIFILLCAAFILYYFLIMPWMRFRHLDAKNISEDKIPEFPDHDFRMHEVKGHSQLLADTFSRFSSIATDMILPLLAFSAAFVGFLYLLKTEGTALFLETFYPSLGTEFTTAIAHTFMQVDQLFNMKANSILFPLDIIFMAVVTIFAMSRLSDLSGKRISDLFKVKNLLRLLGITTAVHMLFWVSTPMSFMLLLLIAPIGLTWAVMHLIPRAEEEEEVSLSSLLSASYLPLLLMTFVLTFTGVLFMLIFNSGITDYLLSQILGNFFTDMAQFNTIMLGINILFTMFSLSFIVILHVFAAFFLAVSSVEKITARHLKNSIQEIGTRDKAYGMLRE
jgi:uncharacterized membrane protein SpoIIM required for sporulation